MPRVRRLPNGCAKVEVYCTHAGLGALEAIAELEQRPLWDTARMLMELGATRYLLDTQAAANGKETT